MHETFSSGIFRPPVNGSYVFTWYSLCHENKGYSYMWKNDEILCGLWIEDTKKDVGACTAAVSKILPFNYFSHFNNEMNIFFKCLHLILYGHCPKHLPMMTKLL